MIRIAVPQGPSAAWTAQADRLVNASPIDFLILDYLSDHSFADLEMRRIHHPGEGYIPDVIPFLEEVSQDLTRRRIRLLTNAGGANPTALKNKILQTLPHSAVSYSQACSIPKEMAQRMIDGQQLLNTYTGNEFPADPQNIIATSIEKSAQSAVKSFNDGTRIVIDGPCTSSTMVLAVVMNAYAFDPENWNALAAGIIAGHLARPDSCCIQYESKPSWRSPLILEVDADGCFTLTKDAGTEGKITTHTVRQQLLHQMGDPSLFSSPDVIADLTTLTVREDGENRVRITGVTGQPSPEKIRMVIYYRSGNAEISEWPTLIEQKLVRSEMEIEF